MGLTHCPIVKWLASHTPLKILFERRMPTMMKIRMLNIAVIYTPLKFKLSQTK